MNLERSETKLILTSISNAFGTSQMTPKERQSLFDWWHNQLKEYEFEKVNRNLNRHIASSQFTPKVADLVGNLKSSKVPNYENTIERLQNEVSLSSKVADQYLADIQKSLRGGLSSDE